MFLILQPEKRIFCDFYETFVTKKINETKVIIFRLYKIKQ